MKYSIWNLALPSYPEHCWTLAAMYLRVKRSHWAILSSIVLRSVSASTDSNSSVNPRARSSLSSPRLSCDEGSCFTTEFRYKVARPVPVLCGIEGRIECFRFFVPPRVVGTDDLPGTAGEEAPCESLVWPRSMFCATRGDHWDGNAVSIICDRVRQENPTQKLTECKIQCITYSSSGMSLKA